MRSNFVIMSQNIPVGEMNVNCATEYDKYIEDFSDKTSEHESSVETVNENNCSSDSICTKHEDYSEIISNNIDLENVNCLEDCSQEKNPEDNYMFSEPLQDKFEIIECNKSLSNEKSEGKGHEDSIKQVRRHRKKLKKILTSVINNDIEYQREAALVAGGLLNDEIRQKVWPALVGVDMFETSPRPSGEEITNHPYYNQVVMDVNRSISRFPPSIEEKQRLSMQDQLVFLIMRVLVQHPEFHYYQGYHDICVTFLLVLGEETAYHVVERLSVSHLNVFMEKTMEPTIRLINHMYDVIDKERPELGNFLKKSEVGVAYCLSWVITWFGHVLNNYDNVVRLFDFIIVSHPWMPMYLSAAIVLHQGSEVMKLECDMACVHSFLAKISDDLPFEELILHSRRLHESYPQQILLKMENNQIRKNRFDSVLKSIKNSVPTSKLTYSLVIAAAVLLTAVLYQAYK